jgi:hypothetical protein
MCVCARGKARLAFNEVKIFTFNPVVCMLEGGEEAGSKVEKSDSLFPLQKDE